MAHTRCCRRKTNGGCPVCKQLIALCCYHAKHCVETKCPVPFCVTIKQKLQQQQLQQRMAQSYMMSRRMAAMRGGAYPTPTPAAPAPPQTAVYHTPGSSSSPGKPAMTAASPAAGPGNPGGGAGPVQAGTVVLIPQQRPSLEPSAVVRPTDTAAGSVDIARNILALQQQQQQRLPGSTSVQQTKTVVLSGGPAPGPTAVVQSSAGGGTLMLGPGDTLIRLPTPETFNAGAGQPQQVAFLSTVNFV